ncbi:MAG: 1-deoxy-D-xylulose-5-phosphate synthase [Planctomycetota bacterium]|nr:1-deoxy-D-xylulose-5-phosphate synthase [Planctomycetota bacterium]
MDKDKLTDRINTPHQLRRLSEDELKQLAEELRQRIIKVVSKRGGHLASNLGITELTIALHYVFDFSHDRLLWDVGHQCYAHKILTGRGRRFDMLRQAGGISGFPAPEESAYDLFATGHAGAAISTAAGLAWADHADGNDSKIVAVVGDASIANGLSLEGINNAALLKRQFLVILNDNSMAIDRTRGALAGVLDRIRMTHTYADIKHSAEHLLQHLPLGEEITEALRNLKTGLRSAIHGGQIFEALGFTYFGPVDGHNIGQLIRLLQRLSHVNQPVLLHLHTEKGRGCQYAVEDPCRFHSPSAHTVQAGRAVFAKKARPTWTEVFADVLVDLASRNEKIVAITAAMPDGTGLVKLRQAYPDRVIDVGINESHAVAMAAGLAKAGHRPVVAVYSTFMQRAFDQAFEELALQKLPVLLCLDRAGLVGSDGAVHHGFMDIAYLRPLPGMLLMAPADAAELRAAMEFALSQGSPAAIRYPRDEVPEELPGRCLPFELGKARIIREGCDATLLCYGSMVEPALAAAETLRRERTIDVGVVNARFAKPLDTVLITRLISAGKPLLICEDHAVAGGFGSAVLELAAARGLSVAHVRLLGLPDRFIAHASRTEQLAEVGLDAAGIIATLKDMTRNGASRPTAGLDIHRLADSTDR